MARTKNRRKSGNPAAIGSTLPRPVSLSEGCDKCNAPNCLALVRAETPPESWKDLLDRQLKLISSGHWGTAQVSYLCVMVVVLVVVISAVGWLVPAVGPIWTGLVGSGALLTGASVWIIRHRRQKAVAAEASGPT